MIGTQKFSSMPSYADLRRAIENIPDAKIQAFMAIQYACAARFSEINGSIRKNKTKVSKRHPDGISITTVEPLKWDAVRYDYKDDAIVFSLQVAKIRNRKKRRDFFIYREAEEWLFDILFHWLFNLEKKTDLPIKKKEGDEPIFSSVVHSTYNRLIIKYIEPELRMPAKSSHFFRYCRITHLRKPPFNLQQEEVSNLIAWDDASQIFRYSMFGDGREKLKMVRTEPEDETKSASVTTQNSKNQ